MNRQRRGWMAVLGLLLALTLIPVEMNMPSGTVGTAQAEETGDGENPEATPTPTPEITPTPTPEITPTPTPEITPTPTPEITPTPTPEITPTPTPEITPTPTPEITPTPTPEITPTPTPEITPTPTPEITPTPTPEITPTPTPEITPTPTPEITPTPEETPSPTPSEEPTDVPTDEPTEKPSEEPTSEPEWEIQGDVLITCRSQAAVVAVPAGIREIGPNAFRKMKTLEVVVLPDTVECIGAGAFADCGRLREVVLSSESRLAVIGSQAFMNCVKLDPGFVPDGAKTAESAFDGAGTDRPTAMPSPVPAETPAETPTAAPTPAPTSTESPEPTETPEDEDDIDEDDIEDEDDTEDEEEPEDDSSFFPAWSGGGGYSSGLPQGHARNTLTSVAEYDLVSLKDIPPEGTAAMTRLILGGEELSVRLIGNDAAEVPFTVSVMHWLTGEDAEEETDGESDSEKAPDTLVLTAIGTEKGVWMLNGEVLRRLHKSGIRLLSFRAGNYLAAVETDGFLAGWQYDLLKSRGIASRRFDYELEMQEENSACWRVTVEGVLYPLSEDDRAGIHLAGAWEGSAEALNLPWEQAEETLEAAAEIHGRTERTESQDYSGNINDSGSMDKKNNMNYPENKGTDTIGRRKKP